MDGVQDNDQTNNENAQQPIIDVVPPAQVNNDSQAMGQSIPVTNADDPADSGVVVEPEIGLEQQPEGEQTSEEAPQQEVNEAPVPEDAIDTNEQPAEQPEADNNTEPTEGVVASEPTSSESNNEVSSQSETVVAPVVPAPPQAERDDQSAEETTANDVGVSADGIAVAGTAAAVAATEAASSPKVKRHVSILPIIVALVVALGLAGLTVYAYQRQQTNKDKTGQASTGEQVATDAPSATPQKIEQQDIDSAVAAADDAIAADDVADTSGNELTDQTLGL